MPDLVETLQNAMSFYRAGVAYLPYVLVSFPVGWVLWFAFTSYSVREATRRLLEKDD